MPEIIRLVENEEYYEALALAQQAEKYIPNDPVLSSLFPRCSRFVHFSTQPPGARVSISDYKSPDRSWNYLGDTPIDSIRLPLRLVRLKFEKSGYRVLSLASNWSSIIGSTFKLDEVGTVPDEMVRVPGGAASLEMSGLDHTKAVQLGEYLIDKYEVTNRDYKKFIDAGGYQRRDFWKQSIVKDGKSISWEQAITQFTDRTGRPGPSTWEVGNYAEGQDDFPVTGVSWYEAAAYAEFAGKSLPTIFHWTMAVNMLFAPYIIPLSNFSNHGLDPVGKNRGIGAFGTFDMAGNAREWCWNLSGNQRFILGGGWDDPAYMFTNGYTAAPFD